MAGSDNFARTEGFKGEPEKEAGRQFVHVAVAYDEDGTIRGYRNGKAYGTPYKKGSLMTFKAGESRVVFGARALPPGQNFMLNGIIREARLHYRALSAGEIAASAGAAAPSEPASIVALIRTADEERSEADEALLRDYYLRHVHGPTQIALQTPRDTLVRLRARLDFLNNEKNRPLQLVSVEMAEPKPAFLLMRGDFQAPGERVDRDVPAFLPPFSSWEPRNRLGLARWLMQTDQPLVARVQVNRFWQMLFGEGLVRSLGDFGRQGGYPTHPELLDWLANQFIESNWDVKRTLRQILLSRTYRQASSDARRHAAIDPENRLLWRAPRVRLSAETIRDNALSIAGILAYKQGGPPVFPYQPDKFYKGKNNGWKWNLSEGDDLYRRGLYTFWRRTTPYPTFVIFDAPDRAECTFERPRTNTPLQALATLNDPQFVEASRVFAQRILSESPPHSDGRIRRAFRLALARQPTDPEVGILQRFVDEQLIKYQANPDAAKELAAAGRSPRPDQIDVVEHAAWTAFANVLLNLDETITRN